MDSLLSCVGRRSGRPLGFSAKCMSELLGSNESSMFWISILASSSLRVFPLTAFFPYLTYSLYTSLYFFILRLFNFFVSFLLISLRVWRFCFIFAIRNS